VQEGLVGEVKIAKTVIGDETLELCADGCLSASAGFALMHENGLSGPIKRGAEIWENNRTVRRLKELWLDHVAFVPNPAYEAANVIDVRRQARPGRGRGWRCRTGTGSSSTGCGRKWRRSTSASVCSIVLARNVLLIG
jgi:phage head maturation protease